jgi:hypothetical protein
MSRIKYLSSEYLSNSKVATDRATLPAKKKLEGNLKQYKLIVKPNNEASEYLKNLTEQLKNMERSGDILNLSKADNHDLYNLNKKVNNKGSQNIRSLLESDGILSAGKITRLIAAINALDGNYDHKLKGEKILYAKDILDLDVKDLTADKNRINNISLEQIASILKKASNIEEIQNSNVYKTLIQELKIDGDLNKKLTYLKSAFIKKFGEKFIDSGLQSGSAKREFESFKDYLKHDQALQAKYVTRIGADVKYSVNKMYDASAAIRLDPKSFLEGDDRELADKVLALELKDFANAECMSEKTMKYLVDYVFKQTELNEIKDSNLSRSIEKNKAFLQELGVTDSVKKSKKVLQILKYNNVYSDHKMTMFKNIFLKKLEAASQQS